MTTTSDVSVLRVRNVVAACIAIILLIALYPLLKTGYAVPDDFWAAIWANSPDRWLISKRSPDEVERNQG